MNSITACMQHTEFVCDPHLVIAIDGVPLDRMLSAACPHQNLNGLVPAMLDWIHDDRERQIVWQRILPAQATRAIAPVLICPDDLDLRCSVVVADVTSTADFVEWTQLGLDHSDPDEFPENIGTMVDWLGGVGPFTFERVEYQRMVDTFRRSTIRENTA
ncbi:MAG: hypothetical protein JNK57_18700 [Planctomycetaceae bacterium]|nr:hypothetical protein [Planctomycetaceae bacterium]